MPKLPLLTAVLAVVLAGPAADHPAAQRSSRYAVVDETTITRTLTFTGNDRTLDIRNINGSIRVQASNESSVHMSIRKVVRAESDADKSDAERDVRLDFVDAQPRVQAVVRDRRDHVCGEESHDDGRWSRVGYSVTFDFTVRVPRDVKLRLCTINGGELTVDGTTGDFDVDNVNGKIEMRQVAGSGDVHTVNGGVLVTFTKNPAGASTFKTVNGNVEVSFQDGLAADFSMKTFNGGLFTDFDVQPLANTMSAQPERRSGRLVYRSNDFTRVRVGNGGPQLTFETLNGNVRALRSGR